MSILKGKTVIELKDQNGNVEIYENENMITNAVPNILNTNPLGCVDANKNFLPLQKMFGGILLFENSLTENVNNIFPTVPPIGWAGYKVNTGGYIKRGSPNVAETGDISNGFKYVWDFSTSQANGTIAAVSLTHGGAGCADRDDMLMNNERFKILYNGGNVWDTTVEEDIQKYNNIIAVDGNYCYSVDLSECVSPITKLNIYKCRKNINNFSLNSFETKSWTDADYPTLKGHYNDEKTNFEYTFSTPFTVATYNTNTVSISEYGGYIYLIQKTTTANQVRIVKIDYKNNTFTDRNITIPSSIKNFGEVYGSNNMYKVCRDIFLIDNNEIYLPCENGNMYSLNLLTNVSTLRYSTNYVNLGGGGVSFKTTTTDGASVLIKRSGDSDTTFDIISKNGITVDIPTSSWNIFSSNGVADIIFTDTYNKNKDGIVHLGNGIYYNSYNKLLWLDTYYLATINNLDTPVTKTSAQTMKITYTLTYV